MNEMTVPEVLDPAAAVKDIAAAVTYSVQLDRNRSFVFQTYIPRDADVKEYRDLVDKLTGSVERLELEEMIRGVEADIATDELGMDAALENFNAIGEKNAADWKRRGKKGEPVLTAAEEQNKRNFAITVKGFKAKIEQKKAGLEALKAKLAGL